MRRLLEVHRPTVRRAGWDVATQVREEFGFTRGRIHARGKQVFRGKPTRVDSLLSDKHNIPARIEAKDNTHGAGDGMP